MLPSVAYRHFSHPVLVPMSLVLYGWNARNTIQSFWLVSATWYLLNTWARSVMVGKLLEYIDAISTSDLNVVLCIGDPRTLQLHNWIHPHYLDVQFTAHNNDFPLVVVHIQPLCSISCHSPTHGQPQTQEISSSLSWEHLCIHLQTCCVVENRTEWNVLVPGFLARIMAV